MSDASHAAAKPLRRVRSKPTATAAKFTAVVLALSAFPLCPPFGSDAGGTSISSACARAAEEPEASVVSEAPKKKEEQKAAAAMPPGKPYLLPQGTAQKPWALLLKNDFAAAKAAFEDALKKEPKNLKLLEGRRTLHSMTGEPRKVLEDDRQMVRAAADSPLCRLFADRAAAMIQEVDDDGKTAPFFLKVAAAAAPPAAADLRDEAASLYLRGYRPAAARKALAGLGYVNRLLFVTGPFGSKNPNNYFEKRYPPEESLKSLVFYDARGKKVPLKKDVVVPFRSLDLSEVMPGTPGVYFAFTNLHSETEQDAIIGLSVPFPLKVFLRGIPIIKLPDDNPHTRAVPLVRVRLLKGDNPLLVKFEGPYGEVAVRVMGLDHAPLDGVVVRALSPQALAAHKTCKVRGLLFSRAVVGALAAWFLKRLPAADRAEEQQRFMELAASGRLDIVEALWLRQVLEEENRPEALEKLARTLAASFPHSVFVLDRGAEALKAAEGLGGHSEIRFAEEAKRLRERALGLRPDDLRNLLALADFFQAHDRPDQALEKLRTCLKAHPNSVETLSRLATVLRQKGDPVGALAYLEKAVRLEPALTPELQRLLEQGDDRVRARELARLEFEKGRLSPTMWFYRLLREGKTDAAEKVLARREKERPDRARQWKRMRAALLTERGRLDDARKVWAEIMAARPEDREALKRRVDLSLRLHKDKEALALLQKRLKKHPGDYELRRQATALSEKKLDRWWKAYDVRVADIDTSRYTQENYPRAGYAWIVDFAALKIHPDLSWESYTHTARKVLNRDGINRLSEALIRARGRDVVMVRTIDKDGTVYEPENVLNFNFARTASHYKVGPGSILEHAYLGHHEAAEDEPSLAQGFNFNEVDAPRAVSRWVVLIPNKLKKKLHIRKIRPELIEEKILPGPPGYTVHQWTNKRKEGIKSEPFMSREETVPSVMIESEPPVYRGTELLQRRRPPVELPEEAAAFARRLTAPLASPREKFDALVRWLRLHFKAGEDAADLDDVWWLRSGQPAQAADLLAALAHAAGLNVRHVHVNTAYRPGRIWRSKYAPRQWEPQTLSYFARTPLLLLETDDGSRLWRLIRFSDKVQADKFDPRALPAAYNGAFAAVVGDDGVRCLRVRGQLLGRTPARLSGVATLDKNGGANIESKVVLFGSAAAGLRYALSDPQMERQARENIPHRLWSRIKLDSFKVEHLKEVRRPLVLRFSGRVEGLAARRREGAALRPFPRGRSALLRFIGPPERKHDLIIDNENSNLDDSVQWVAPPGYGWTEVPDDLFFVTEFGWYLADFNVRGRTLYCTRSYLLPQQRIPPEKYEAFQKFLKRVAKTERQQALYAPVEAPGFTAAPRAVFSGGYSDNGAPPPKKKKNNGKKKDAPQKKAGNRTGRKTAERSSARK